MNKRKVGSLITVVIVILLIAGIIFYLTSKLADRANYLLEKKREKETAQIASSLNSYDYSIYWIGVPPEGLEELVGDHMVIIAPQDVSEENMPIFTMYGDITISDRGQVITQNIHRDYPEHLLIINNAAEQLSEDAMDIQRRCAVDNNVPVLLIGTTQIDDFRSVMLMSAGQYGPYSSMLFSSNNGVNPVVMDEGALEAGGRNYLDGIMTFAQEVFDLPLPTPVVVGTVPPPETSVADDGTVYLVTPEVSEPSPTETSDVTIESTIIYIYGN